MMAMVVGSGMGGWLNSLTGRYTPWIFVGGTLCAIAGGLLFTIDQNTSNAKIIGYQILLGFGEGIAFNQPSTSFITIAIFL